MRGQYQLTEARMRPKLYSRRLILVTFVLITAFGSAHVASAQTKSRLKPLHIALANNSVTMTSIYVAKHLGIFESYGFDPRVLVLEPRAGIAALLTGDLHFYTAIASTGRAEMQIPGEQRS